MTETKKLTSLRELYKDDIKAVEDGAWRALKYGGIFVKVRALHSQFVGEFNNNLMARFKTDLGVDTLPIEALNNIAKELTAKAILTDWKNVADEKGAEIIYTPEVAFEFFKEEGMDRLVDEIFNVSADVETFRASNTRKTTELLKKK